MPVTFDDLMNAGKIDEKKVTVRGMELTVKPLTLAENTTIQKLHSDGKGEEAVIAMIQAAVVDPKISALEARRMRECNAAFIGELADAIAKAIKAEPGESEKN